MNGFIKQTASLIAFGAAVVTLIGCQHYRDVVDPCWPERYNYMARDSVREMHNAQADKGHVLNHTIWNDDFEGDKLKPSAKAKLKYIAHREPPAVLMMVYLQNADNEDPAQRDTVNANRRKAILAYLDTQKSGKTQYDVAVHNYVQPTYRADWTTLATENVEKNIKSGQPQVFVQPTSSTGGGGAK